MVGKTTTTKKTKQKKKNKYYYKFQTNVFSWQAIFAFYEVGNIMAIYFCNFENASMKAM